jgi:PRTRC genetic system protein E
VRACPGALGILNSRFHCTWNIKEENVFVELMPLLKGRTLLLTIARVGEKVKVNVIPKAREGEDQALTTPLSYTAAPEELDAELGKHLASYVDTHVALGSTLAEAKAEMDAAAKAARQKAKTTQAPKTDAAIAKKAETPTSPSTTEATPSLFSAPHSTESPASSSGGERKES